MDVIEVMEEGEELPGSEYLSRMWSLINQGQWPEVTSAVLADELLSIDRLETVLEYACLNPNTPIEVFRTILDVAGVEAVRSLGSSLSLPLHTCTCAAMDRPDVVQLLVDASPQTVRDLNIEGLRPIDTVTQQIIMKEEHERYLKRHHQEFARQELERHLNANWQSAAILARAHARSGNRRRSNNESSYNDDTLMIHACLSAPDIPLSLIERALKRYRDQLSRPDSHGNLPLHLVSSQPPPQEDDDDDSDDLLVEILNAYPDAARVYNEQGQLPLDLAIAAGRRWNTGVGQLLQAYPASIMQVIREDATDASYPLFLAELGQRGQAAASLTFEILRTRPDLVRRPTSHTI